MKRALLEMDRHRNPINALDVGDQLPRDGLVKLRSNKTIKAPTNKDSGDINFCLLNTPASLKDLLEFVYGDR